MMLSAPCRVSSSLDLSGNASLPAEPFDLEPLFLGHRIMMSVQGHRCTLLRAAFRRTIALVRKRAPSSRPRRSLDIPARAPC
jgi:hypothetical protein